MRPRLPDAPAGVAGPVPFGPRLEALACCLRYVQHLPTARLCALLRELHGVALATGTVEALCRRAAARLEACMDETSLRVAGERLWLHVLCNGTLTCYRLGARGDIGKTHVGTAVHDRFASYLSQLPDETAHGICNAHLLRDLEAMVAWEKAPDGWAARMQRLLLEARAGVARLARMQGLAETARKRGQTLLDLLRLDPDEPWPDPVPP